MFFFIKPIDKSLCEVSSYPPNSHKGFTTKIMSYTEAEKLRLELIGLSIKPKYDCEQGLHKPYWAHWKSLKIFVGHNNKEGIWVCGNCWLPLDTSIKYIVR